MPAHEPTRYARRPDFPLAPRAEPVAFIRAVCDLDLRPFQVRWLRELFRERRGTRRYSEALWGLPRGNGKTEIGAAIALKMLLADGTKNAEVYIAAGSRDQAMIAFTAAQRMVESSSWLAERCHVRPGYKRIYASQGATLHVISAEAPMQHGLRPSCVIFDEVWNQKSRDLYDALQGGLVKRPESLLVSISSAGYDHDSLLWELCKRGERGEDPRFFYQWHQAPADADHTSPRTWRQANPALACRRPFLRRQGLEDSLARMHESAFRRWHLGQWTAAENVWIAPAAWDACDADAEIPDGAEVVLGVDAAIRHDSTAVATVYRDPDGVVHATFRIFIPPPDVDLGLVAAFIREQCRRYRVRAVCFDPHFMAGPAQQLAAEEVPMVEWRQDNARMVPATQTLHELVRFKRLRHGGNPFARSHALAAGVRETERGIRIWKSATPEPNDAVVALAMAVEWLGRTTEPRPSVYETRGMVRA